MGSKAWNQTVPWESDLSAALARAQEATIRDGVYAQSYTPELPPKPTAADVRAAFDCDGSGSEGMTRQPMTRPLSSHVPRGLLGARRVRTLPVE